MDSGLNKASSIPAAAEKHSRMRCQDEDAGGRLAVAFSFDRVKCDADVGVIGRNDTDTHPKPFLPTTMEVDSPLDATFHEQ